MNHYAVTYYTLDKLHYEISGEKRWDKTTGYIETMGNYNTGDRIEEWNGDYCIVDFKVD